jgi:hypothetical protein
VAVVPEYELNSATVNVLGNVSQGSEVQVHYDAASKRFTWKMHIHSNLVICSTVLIKLSCTEFCLTRGKRNFAENRQRVFILTNALSPVLLQTPANLSHI